MCFDYLLFSPGHMSSNHESISKIANIHSRVSISRFRYHLSPVLLCMNICIGETSGSRSNGCAAVEMPAINGYELIIVVRVGVRVIECVGVIHASVEVGAGFILMGETPVMTNLL